MEIKVSQNVTVSNLEIAHLLIDCSVEDFKSIFVHVDHIRTGHGRYEKKDGKWLEKGRALTGFGGCSGNPIRELAAAIEYQIMEDKRKDNEDN